MIMIAVVFLLVLIAFVLNRCILYRRFLSQVDNLPGLRCLFSPFSAVGAMLPTGRFNPGMNWNWIWRNRVYESFSSDTISIVPFVLGPPMVYTRSAEAIKQILSGSSSFHKTAETTAPIRLWGNSVFAADHDDYKRHRRIVGPSFTSNTYPPLWRESASLYNEMVESEGWPDSKVTSEIHIPSASRLASKFTMAIIARCAFGQPIAWQRDINHASDSVEEKALQDMPFGDALRAVSEGAICRLAAPRWAYKLGIKTLSDLDRAYTSLRKFMTAFAAFRRAEIAEKSVGVGSVENDLFTRLVVANEKEGKNGLTDDELIGNTFAFLFAGHETSAHVLAATLALLALHQDKQEAVVEQINAVFSAGHETSYEDYPKLDKVLACFLEACRLFPAGAFLIRDTTEEVRLRSTTGGLLSTMTLPEGTRVVVDMIGYHNHPEYFPDPDAFKPERWYGQHLESELTMFGFGPRACLGRKFAMVEAVCFLAHIFRDWKLDIILLPGESRAAWRARVLQGRLLGLAFGVKDVPLRMTRRV
ncbi:cytochrome P450 [Schizopora paradoxa]|uniref:Cytochrome P450 n=1 Tax=Schizopora paradoxa TaxID=27342 RepID=A0A0H2SBA2_9AGAM|nr:cytochrome P450 [Schizopora paradoxa]